MAARAFPSILVVNDEWGAKNSWAEISTVHREICSLAKEIGATVYSTTLKASDIDKQDCDGKQVKLIEPQIKARLPKNERTPKVSWLIQHESFFPDLKNIPKVDIIIGHAPVTDDAALEIREHVFPAAKLYLFNHVIPEDIEAYQKKWSMNEVQEKEKKILDAAREAAAVFSVGPRIFEHYRNKFRALDAKDHIKYIPRPEQQFFDVQMSKLDDIRTMRVITFGHISGVERLKGYDLVVSALSRVAEAYHSMFENPPEWIIRGIPKDEQEQTMEFLNDNMTSGHLNIKPYPYGSKDDIRRDLQQSHLCILTSRSEPFGLIGLEAIAAGIPTLITKNSGLAQYLEGQFPLLAQAIVVDVGINEVSKNRDIEKWKQEIIRVLRGYSVAFNRAQELKKELSNCMLVKTSHEAFKDFCLK
ncbi:uncharacterized protein [Ptychodera flava]|uniref:uncharacterized protein n=1 Tax=Ptychodera flava TaxID=63121 RepID=UPI00396A520E